MADEMQHTPGAAFVWRGVQRTRERHGIIYPEDTPDPEPTSCAYCDAKLATLARKCDNCGAAVKEASRG